MVDSSSHASDVEVQAIQTKLDCTDDVCSISHTKMCPPNSHAWRGELPPDSQRESLARTFSDRRVGAVIVDSWSCDWGSAR